MAARGDRDLVSWPRVQSGSPAQNPRRAAFRSTFTTVALLRTLSVALALDCTSQAAHAASAGSHGALRFLRRHTRGVAWCRRVFQLASGFRKHTSVGCYAMHMPLLQSCVIHTWSNILCMPPHASVWYLGALAWLQPQPRHSIPSPIPAAPTAHAHDCIDDYNQRRSAMQHRAWPPCWQRRSRS